VASTNRRLRGNEKHRVKGFGRITEKKKPGKVESRDREPEKAGTDGRKKRKKPEATKTPSARR